jgi:hypothetical protein
MVMGKGGEESRKSAMGKRILTALAEAAIHRSRAWRL